MLCTIATAPTAYAKGHAYVLGLVDTAPNGYYGYEATAIYGGYGLRYTTFVDRRFTTSSTLRQSGNALYNYEVLGDDRVVHLLKVLAHQGASGAGGSSVFEWASAYLGVGYGEHKIQTTQERYLAQGSAQVRQEEKVEVKFTSQTLSFGITMMEKNVALDARLSYTQGSVPLPQGSDASINRFSLIFGIGFGF